MFNPDAAPQETGPEVPPQPGPEVPPQEGVEPGSPEAENNPEKTPEKVLDSALATIGKWDAADPIFTIPGIRHCGEWLGEKQQVIKEKYG